MTPDRLLRWLLSFPFPGALAVMQGDELTITLEGEVLRFDGAWRAPDGQRIPHTFPEVPNADDIHAGIRRGLAIARGITGASWHNVEPEPAPSWEDIKADCVGPDLPADDPYIPTRAEIAAEPPPEDTLYDRITDEIDRRKDIEAQLAKMTDAHAVVSQRLVGSQKEVAEVTTQRDEIAAAHSALHTESEARRRADLRAVKAFTTIAEVFGVDPADVGKVCEVVADQRRRVPELERERDDATARADKVEDRLRRDDDLRSAIAVAVGLDGSASLALILDTVTRDRPGREISRLSGLLDVLAAPVAFGERRLSTVERAEWALRRALRERDECTPRMAQLIEAEVCLDVLGVPAYAAVPGDDPGDASEALTVAERIRLHFGAQS